MAEIISLRRARKEQARKAASDQAAANRVRHGRTKAQRMNETAENARIASALNGARRDPD